MSISPVQECLLKMMVWFHNYCVNNGITYYAIGGTLLGMARHNGFIPWDDDLDVGLPRMDYERICKLLTEENGKHPYEIETIHMMHKDYSYAHAKIYDIKTTVIEKRRVNVTRGLSMDLFPIDGTGNTMEEALRFYSPICKRIDLLTARIVEIRKGRSLYKNAASVLAKLIPSWCCDMNKEIIEIDNALQKYNYDSSNLAGNLYGLKRKREIMPKSYFGKPTLGQFEDAYIYGTEDPNKLLTHIYGENWNEMPPVEKQVTHHNWVSYDLHKGYKESMR